MRRAIALNHVVSVSPIDYIFGDRAHGVFIRNIGVYLHNIGTQLTYKDMKIILQDKSKPQSITQKFYVLPPQSQPQWGIA
jgi:hypothetical protein